MRESPTPSDSPSRRQLLVLGAATACGLAGCLGGDSTSTDTQAGPTATETGTGGSLTTPIDAASGGNDGDSDGSTDGGGDNPADGDAEGSNGDGKAAIDADFPITGETVPELQVFDETMVAFMTDLDVSAGALSVAREGEVVFQRGYGWGDRERTTPIDPEAFFRIGSISKLFTMDAVLRLVDDGGLALADRVYPLLDVEPPGGELADERIRDVTVEHLLGHASGWDRSEHANPLYNPVVVTEALDLDGPPTKEDIVQYMLDQPLQFEPGTDSIYSNLGYVLLGMVVESVTGRSYQEHLEATLFGPADIDAIELGRTRPESRHPDEVWYEDDERCPNVFEGDDERSYECASHGIVLQAFEAAGGHIARSHALVRAVAELDWLWTGGEAYRSPEVIRFAGSHPGSFAYTERQGEVTVGVMVNTRDLPLGPYLDIQQLVNDAIADVDQWP
jgi:hypothetical protein